jgi:SAM-dependent methyltransferase
MGWLEDNTNTALRSHTDVSIAIEQLEQEALPLHSDRAKNWDSYLAVSHARQFAKPHEAVLDAGACPGMSVFLPGLHQTHSNLYGMNNDRNVPAGIIHDIFYIHDDITLTDFDANTFAFVACLSVLEHGVDIPRFFKEMARIIKPQGGLFVSFDYWQHPIDVGDRQACGVPVKIFEPADLVEMLGFAADNGLALTGSSPEFKCSEKVVHWLGLDYTFANLLFTKRCQ